MTAAQSHMTILQGRLLNHDFEMAERHLRSVVDSVNTLSTTLDHLLTAARYDSGTEPIRIESVELGPILVRIRETFAAEAETRRIELRVRDPLQRVVVTTDATAIWRVLMNLVSNAIKFTEATGKPGRGVLVRVTVSSGTCRIDVADTGVGIAREHLDAIWQPYFQISNSERNRHRGLGLGLFLVRRVIDRLPEHSLTLRSLYGRGSRFTVQLPGILLSEPRFLAPPVDSLSEDDLVQLSGASVVLLEDNMGARDAIRQLLEEWSVVVTCAGSFDELIPMLADLERSVDCIVSDYRLPGDLNGGQCVVELRRLLEADVPAVIVTGESDINVIRPTLPRDTVLMQKPFDAIALAVPLVQAARRARLTESST